MRGKWSGRWQPEAALFLVAVCNDEFRCINGLSRKADICEHRLPMGTGPHVNWFGFLFFRAWQAVTRAAAERF